MNWSFIGLGAFSNSLEARLKQNGISIDGGVQEKYSSILTFESLQFVATLERNYRARRAEILANRVAYQKEIDAGGLPDFLSESESPIPAGKKNFQIAPLPEILTRVGVEITGPASKPNFLVNMLNAYRNGAVAALCDAEDAESPTWSNLLDGQLNLYKANRRQIDFHAKGKDYKLDDTLATIKFRPRGWHLEEAHMLVDGKPISASLFDFGLYFFNNTQQLIQNGSVPAFYFPKMEGWKEAKLWNDIMTFSEQSQGIANGTARASVLVEHPKLAFQMNEVLYAMRDHIDGLNVGRWDYLFGLEKLFAKHPAWITPDRDQINMEQPMMVAYQQLLVKTCLEHGAMPLGGMSAFVPTGDAQADAIAMNQIRYDKAREAGLGLMRTWVPHPATVVVAAESFNTKTELPKVDYSGLVVTRDNLVQLPQGDVTYAGFKKNMMIEIEYWASWFRGNGAAALYGKMEDVATAEISRTQNWNKLHKKASIKGAPTIVHVPEGIVTPELVEQAFLEVTADLKGRFGEQYANGKYIEATNLARHHIYSKHMPAFGTIAAYEMLNTMHKAA